MPERAIARNNKLFFFMCVCIVLFVGLFLLYSINAKRANDRTTKRLQAQAQRNTESIHAACVTTNKARRESNAQLRAPLKQMFGYFVSLVEEQIAENKRSGKRITAKQEERQYDFLLRFRKFYDAVKLLPQLDCGQEGV